MVGESLFYFILIRKFEINNTTERPIVWFLVGHGMPKANSKIAVKLFTTCVSTTNMFNQFILLFILVGIFGGTL